MFTDRSVADLLDAFSSPDPTPGGGSAAALSGAIGASLLAMVAGIPKTKTVAPEERATLDAARLRLLGLRAQLVDLIDRDAAAYDLVVAAYKQPKATDDEKAARKVAIQAAMRAAAEVPLETMRACAETIEAGTRVAGAGNPSAQSDVAVGLQMAATGLRGAKLNVDVNLGSLTDPAIAETISQAEGLEVTLKHLELGT